MDGVIEYLSDNDAIDGRSREGSLSREVSYSFGNKQFGIHGNEFNLVYDFELQEAITKDFHSYILLSKSVIKAMRIEANRTDTIQQEQYVKDLELRLHIDTEQPKSVKKSKSIFRRFKRKLSNSKKKTNIIGVPNNKMPVSPVEEDYEK